MCTTEEKTLKAIFHTEEARKIYNNIKGTFGKEQVPLTQVDFLSDPGNKSSAHTTLTSKEDIEENILRRNRHHSLQSLSTPFFTHPLLHQAISPSSNDNLIDQLLDNKILNDEDIQQSFSDTEKAWIEALHQRISSEISLSFSCKDFKNVFRFKQERTSSSPSGRHFGHYRSMLECFRQNNLSLPSLIVSIAQISLSTTSPLKRWQTASQVMLEKGKGCFVENLRITQLCEADLNFVLHVIWGHRLIRHAKKHKSQSTSQYAIPGETCNNAVLNKVLFCDLSRQSLSPGILTDFDATAAFDRVIAGLSIATCERVGLPHVSGHLCTFSCTT
jgi:hypothetical protein